MAPAATAATAASPQRPTSFIQVLVARALAALQPADAEDVPADDVADLAPGALGPGWFDSSWELACGLVVREGLPADPTLDEWLTFNGNFVGVVA